MKKIAFHLLLIVIITIILSSCFTLKPDDFLTATLYTISGILFSIGLSLIVTFNIQGVKNPSFIKNIRQRINTVKWRYIIYFGISSFTFIAENYIDKGRKVFTINAASGIYINWTLLVIIIIIFSIIYFIGNMLQLQKFNNEIADEVLKSE